MAKSASESYSEKEAQERFEAALRSGLNTQPKPHSEMKLGKRKAARKKSPAARTGKPQKKPGK